jgi:hypothetical protein
MFAMPFRLLHASHRLTLALVVCLLLVRPALALDPAEGPVVLEVSGAIAESNRPDGTAVFDMALLERHGGRVLRTETPWTEGMAEFEGIDGRVLAELLGAEGETVVARALNDYQVEIPLSDFAEGRLMIAYRMNGETMSVRDKGPLWVIYPFSEDETYLSVTYQTRSIWQLRHLEVR